MRKSMQTIQWMLVAIMMVTSSFVVTASVAQPEPPLQSAPALQAEPIPNVVKMPRQLPPNLVFVHDLAFFGITAGRVLLVDVAAETRNVLGMVGAAQAATFRQSARRGEFYVAESFFERGTRGKQTDVMTIYDAKTLQVAGEVVLPPKKRFQVVGEQAAFQLTKNEKFALIFNFTPAQSVTIIDLDKRKIVNEINLPGCMLTYPYGRSGFATLCGDGSLLAIELDRRGRENKKTIHQTEKFNDIDNNPLFMDAAWVGQTAYFPTFNGHIQPIQLGGGKPKVMKAWRLQTDMPQAAANARPAGYQIIATDKKGMLYVMMRANAQNGEHKHPSGEVWVVDPKTQMVVDIIQLETEGIGIEITKAPQPLLAVINANFEIDVYDIATKKHIRTIGGWHAGTPLGLYAGQ